MPGFPLKLAVLAARFYYPPHSGSAPVQKTKNKISIVNAG